MRYLYPIIGFAGLILLLVSSVLGFTGDFEPDRMKSFMFVATLVWFAGAIPWLGRKKQEP